MISKWKRLSTYIAIVWWTTATSRQASVDAQLNDTDIVKTTITDNNTTAVTVVSPQDDSLTRLEIIIIVVGGVLTITILGFCVLLCAVLIAVKKKSKMISGYRDSMTKAQNQPYDMDEDHTTNFPHISYHQDTTPTVTHSAPTFDPPPDPPVVLSPSYATVSPFNFNKEIVYEDSFERTGGGIGLWDQNSPESMYRNGETNELLPPGSGGARERILSRSMSLTSNEAYGVGAIAGDGSSSSDESEHATTL